MSTKILRRMSQLVVVAFVVFVGIKHQVIGGGPEGSAALDAYCPFGGIETLWQYITTGSFISKTNYSNLILLFSVLTLTIFAGYAFCSWLCPFGAIQEALGFIGRKIFGKQFELPEKIDKVMRYMRFVVLFVILFFTFKTATLVFEEYDPFKVLFHFNFETTTAYVVLALTLIVSILFDRAWCKYFCPLGGLMAFFAPLNMVKVKRTKEACINCDLCNHKCPAKIKISELETVPDGKCIKCLDCFEVCPKQGALQLQIGGNK